MKNFIYFNRQKLLDWLRKKYNIHIEISYDCEYDSKPWHYNIRYLNKIEDRIWKTDYSSYDEALKAALKEVYEDIKNME